MRQRAVGQHVKLEPESTAGFIGDSFHGRHRAGGERERNARRARRARQRELTLEPHQSRGAGGRNHQWHLVLDAEDRGVLVALGYVNEGARLEAQAVEYGAVVLQRHFVFGAAVHEFKEPLGHAFQRDIAQIENIVCVQVFFAHVRYPLGCVNDGSALARAANSVVRRLFSTTPSPVIMINDCALPRSLP